MKVLRFYVDKISTEILHLDFKLQIVNSILSFFLPPKL